MPHRLATTVWVASIFAAGITLPLSQPRSEGVEDKYLETIKVSENVYVFKPKIDWNHGNGVAIIGPDGVFFIDTYIQFNYAEEAIRRLRRVTKLPVRYVLNTHWHNDHVTGNGVFKREFPTVQIITHDSTVAPLEKIVRPAVDSELVLIPQAIALLDGEVTKGTTGRRRIPIVGTMKPFWAQMLSNVRDYQKEFRPARFANADITFSDTLTMRWGTQTLRMIHMAENGHSAGDVVVWIPEQRILATGDLVVGPTPYATYHNIPGMVKALHALIAMNPAIVIPGHGVVQHDLAYMQLLERAFTEYRQAAEAAVAAKVPEARALDSLALPEIDRLFVGDDPLKKWAYQSFFVRNVIHNTYKPTPGP
jgi:glyoxylase-like metal-dependent hydrolase (beta-lactamase superfamily II)